MWSQLYKVSNKWSNTFIVWVHFKLFRDVRPWRKLNRKGPLNESLLRIFSNNSNGIITTWLGCTPFVRYLPIIGYSHSVWRPFQSIGRGSPSGSTASTVYPSTFVKSFRVTQPLWRSVTNDSLYRLLIFQHTIFYHQRNDYLITFLDVFTS